MLYTILLYNLILLAAILLALQIRSCQGRTAELVLRLLLLLTLWIPAALRYGIGTDYPNYVAIYQTPTGEVLTMEPGFRWINLGLNAIGANVQWMFAIVALVTYLPIVMGVRRKWILPVVTIYMLTLYLVTYSLIRQSIAISLIIMALSRYEEDQNISLAYGWLALATFFHLSAAVAVPLLLIRKIRLSGWVAIALLPLLYFISTHGFIDFIFSSNLFLGTRYGKYATNSHNHATELGSGLGVLLRMIIPLLYLAFTKREDEKENIILYAVLCYIISYTLSIQVHIFNRLVDIFSFAPVVAFGALYQRRKKPLLLAAVIVLLFINYQKTIVDNPSSRYGGLGINPYVSILDQR